MKKNMGKADRVIRLTIAAIIIILMITGSIEGTLLIVLGIVAVIFLITPVISFCPLYAPFGFSTRGKDAGS